jgi:hypothetical protein
MAKPATGTRKSGKKNRKLGRNKTKCERYRSEDRHEKNKIIHRVRIEKRLNKRKNKRVCSLT